MGDGPPGGERGAEGFRELIPGGLNYGLPGATGGAQALEQGRPTAAGHSPGGGADGGGQLHDFGARNVGAGKGTSGAEAAVGGRRRSRIAGGPT